MAKKTATRRKQDAKTRPVTDRRRIRPGDSEDQAGVYAPLNSPDDSGESDDGTLAHAPHFREKKEDEL